MVFKYIIGAIAICLSFSATVAHSVPSYDYNAGGEIIGISNVFVEGNLWDMTLHDGSYDDLYATMGTAALYSDLFSHAASDALHAFTDTDTFPPATFLGCTSLTNCRLSTAFRYDIADSRVTVWYDNYAVVPASVGGGRPSSNVNLDNLTFATWALNSSNVPEPSIAILMASGLIAFGFARRKV